MTDVTTESAPSSTSTTEKMKERAGEGAQQIQEKVSEAKMRTRERLGAQINTRSTETGEQMTNTASALRETAQQLRNDQEEPQAKLLEQIAEPTERFGRYLTETSGDRLLHDVEQIARRRPWLVASGGVVLGFLGARVMKAASSRRYEADERRDYGVAATEMPMTPALPAGSAVSGRGGGDGGDV
jgi:hypothetical protein